jgi:murein DD-endopeptidase MepM/ murein hydrolase activator NlpD
VTIAGPDGGYGNMVEIDHGNGLSTRYAHMASITVSEVQLVQAGQTVGHIGMTGRTTGPHLHYETRIDGEPVDPLRFLKAGNRLFSENPDAFRQD